MLATALHHTMQVAASSFLGGGKRRDWLTVLNILRGDFLGGQVLRTQSRQLRLLIYPLLTLGDSSIRRFLCAVHLLVAVVAHFTVTHDLHVAIKVAAHNVRVNPVAGSRR